MQAGAQVQILYHQCQNQTQPCLCNLSAGEAERGWSLKFIISLLSQIGKFQGQRQALSQKVRWLMIKEKKLLWPSYTCACTQTYMHVNLHVHTHINMCKHTRIFLASALAFPPFISIRWEFFNIAFSNNLSFFFQELLQKSLNFVKPKRIKRRI